MPNELLEAILNTQPIFTLFGCVTILGGHLIALLSLRLSILIGGLVFGCGLIFASEIMTFFLEILYSQHLETVVSGPEAQLMLDSQPTLTSNDEFEINETADVKKDTKGKSVILDICISLGILIFAYKFCSALYRGLRARTMRAEIIREFSRRERPQEAPQQREPAEPAPIILSEQDSDSDFCSMSKRSLKTSRKIQLD
jgi:hypothetical protein